MTQKPTRKIKGVFIPIALWNSDLTWWQKCFVAEINQLDDDETGEGCWASNEHLAALFETSPETVRVLIHKLKKLGWLADRKPMFSGDQKRRLMMAIPVIPATENRSGHYGPIKENVEVKKEEGGTTTDQQVQPKSLPDQIKEEWNAVDGLPKVRSLGPSRVRTIKARLKDETWREDWRSALAKIPESDFLMGRVKNDREWMADFDWFIKPESVTRILEGKYQSSRSSSRLPTADEYRAGF